MCVNYFLKHRTVVVEFSRTAENGKKKQSLASSLSITRTRRTPRLSTTYAKELGLEYINPHLYFCFGTSYGSI